MNSIKNQRLLAIGEQIEFNKKYNLLFEQAMFMYAALESIAAMHLSDMAIAHMDNPEEVVLNDTQIAREALVRFESFISKGL